VQHHHETNHANEEHHTSFTGACLVRFVFFVAVVVLPCPVSGQDSGQEGAYAGEIRQGMNE